MLKPSEPAPENNGSLGRGILFQTLVIKGFGVVLRAFARGSQDAPPVRVHGAMVTVRSGDDAELGFPIVAVTGKGFRL